MSVTAWLYYFESMDYRTIGSRRKKEGFGMKEEKTAWIDEENKIVSFRAIDNAEMVVKAENLFWDFLLGLMNSGYRVM